jgi:molybdopterin-containing oxidoreductase family iron-sulfur binding subunit
MPIGQGHEVFGRFASDKPGNPSRLLPDQTEAASGGILWSLSGLTVERINQTQRIANTDGSYEQHGRGIAQAIDVDHYLEIKGNGHKPHVIPPMPEGYDRGVDFYPAHRHVDYRWVMVVDLDRCIGCGACVVACNAENNVAIVRRNRVLQGREMSWLRIQRYYEAEWPQVRFVPMLCQHCDNAPCESVCPVYAPHHSKEGLNNQVYNRCIGTRFCSQNCPYKVRRFNWFTYTRPKPLNWQLNPDVTVRQKGVMEKCSFCVQRIVDAKNRVRDERRKVRDGEVIPACVQTCPTDALVFGNLKDPNARVSELIKDPRAYQVFEHLNTKSAVIYLKKVIISA